MKTLTKILAVATAGVVLGGTLPAQAALSDFSNGGSGSLYTGGGSSLNQVIPDNTPAGVGYAINFAATGLTLNNITVSLNISGGYNGDLYAYVSHGSQIGYLLHPNPAVSGSGFNVTFVEGTGTPLPTGGSGILTGSYTAYSDLSAFNSTDPNGSWNIFFADLSPGDTSTLNSFSVAISAVPEPVNVALGLFGGAFAAGLVGRWMCHRRLAVKAAKMS